MKYSKWLPQSERRHFMKCRCGEYFDMRDELDVKNHLHRANLPKVKEIYSEEWQNLVDFVHVNRKKKTS